MMKTRLMRGLALCMACVVLALAPAHALWGQEDANLAAYQAAYGQDAAAYKPLRYGSSGQEIAQIKERLNALGFFTNRINTNYYKTLEVAVRVFCQQLRIGGNGREVTPLMRAMLDDTENLPRAVSPGIDIYEYSQEKDGTQFTPYTYARLMRNNTINQVRVSFSGQIIGVHNEGGAQYLVVRMESGADKLVYVSYQPLPRTTRFQNGDTVAVFGTTQGLQSLPQEDMTEARLLVHADRVGFKGK